MLCKSLGVRRPFRRRHLSAELRDHYLDMADVELAAFSAAVTDPERFRGFEGLSAAAY
jgi:hypothetical protein